MFDIVDRNKNGAISWEEAYNLDLMRLYDLFGGEALGNYAVLYVFPP